MGRKHETTEVIDLTSIPADELLEIIDELPDEPETPVVTEPKKPKNAKTEPKPSNLTPKMLDEMFQLGDGGRTVRRYLRKYFSESHTHKAGWDFTPEEATKVIEFFTARFAPSK